MTKWGVFESVEAILSFSHEVIDKGKSFSTIKVVLAPVASCHICFGDKTAS